MRAREIDAMLAAWRRLYAMTVERNLWRELALKLLAEREP